MEFAIIGTGSVGSNLGAGLAAAGHEVVYGSRDPEDARVRELVSRIGETARATTVGEAVGRGAAVVLALPPEVAIDVAGDHAEALAGRPVIDPTNRYPTAGDRPVAEDIAAAAPDAGLVKAFNTIGAEHFRDPKVGGRRASMLVAGDDVPAKELALSTAEELSFDSVDAGGLDRAGELEAMARLWIDLAGDRGRDLAFALLSG